MLNVSAVRILAEMKIFASANVTNLVWQDRSAFAAHLLHLASDKARKNNNDAAPVD